jgi:uncharacterized protein YpbB
MLLDSFDLQSVIETITSHLDSIQGKRLPDIENAFSVARNLLARAEHYQNVAVKFKPQLETLLKENDLAKLKDRVTKAIDYFTKGIADELLDPLDKHIGSLKGASKIKKYLKQISTVRLGIIKKIQSIENARLGDISLNSSDARMAVTVDTKLIKQKKGKAEKGASLHETLSLVRQGSSIPDIAKKRALAISTIEGHIAMLVKSGEVDIHQVIDDLKLSRMINVIGESQPSSLTVIKEKLGDNYSYGEIRTVMNHLEFLSKEHLP